MTSSSPRRALRALRQRLAPVAYRWLLGQQEPRARFPRVTGFTILSEDEFLRLRIAQASTLSRRSVHLDLVTDGGRCRTFGDVLEHLAGADRIATLLQRVVETDTSRVFDEPLHRSLRFWTSGNNFFLYRVLYGFRRGVVAYQDANAYIRAGRMPLLYSREYFESLPLMSDAEIAELLKRDPIAIRAAGALRTGRHRAFAMVGRLLAGKPYRPLWAYLN